MAELQDADLIRTVAAMADHPGWWAVAGGWACDLHAGHPTRRHDDVEVTTLRADLGRLRAAFDAQWRFVEPHPAGLEDGGTLRPWDGEPLVLPVHQVCVDLEDGRVDVVLSESRGERWCYRRHPAVTIPLAEAVRHRDGIPYLAPAIVLLFKSKHRRPKDEHDRALLLPMLEEEERSWLRAALQTADPQNPWLTDL